MKRLTVAFVLFVVLSCEAFAWGQKGHDVTCAIAEQHLSAKAAREISRILDGKSIVYWSSWLDNASHTPEFRYTSTWHYLNIDEGETYENAPRNKDGDVVTAINAQIAALKSGTLNKQAEATALKMLVHLVGDLHCPMHISHASDRGGNLHQVQYFNSGKNLHSIWDSSLIEDAHRWTYSEWVEQIDRTDRKTIAAITSGTIDDWTKETYGIACCVYESTPVGSKLSYDEVSTWTPVIEQQLLRGGLRLAYILNGIFR